MRALVALLAALAAASALAQVREAPPPPGTPHAFRLPAKETIRLDNGLAATFIDYGSVPKVTLLAVVRTGNIDEGEDTWLPDVAVEMLKEGTTSRSAYDIAKAAAGMGGALGLGVGPEQTTASISVLSDHGVAAVELLADVLRNPRFPESELPRVRANFERSLAVARADPQALADEALARLVFGDHPFGRALPREDQLAGYDIAKLRGFYERNFGARRTHVYVAGRYDRPALEAALRQAFQDWRPGEPPTDLPAKPAVGLQLALVDSPGAPQSSVRVAVPVPDPASALYFQTTLMNSLLGGTFGSRITSNIREDKGYSYSPDSSINARRGVALWTLSAEITAEHTAAALTEIFSEIERLQGELPTEAELTPVKKYRAGVFVISNSSPNGVLGQLAFMDLHGLPDDFLVHWVENVQAVTPAQVSDMARRFVRLEHMAVVVAGDLAKVGDSVRALPQFAGARMP
jgi:predicted Zn-dependent peptidase